MSAPKRKIETVLLHNSGGRSVVVLVTPPPGCLQVRRRVRERRSRRKKCLLVMKDNKTFKEGRQRGRRAKKKDHLLHTKPIKKSRHLEKKNQQRRSGEGFETGVGGKGKPIVDSLRKTQFSTTKKPKKKQKKNKKELQKSHRHQRGGKDKRRGHADRICERKTERTHSLGEGRRRRLHVGRGMREVLSHLLDGKTHKASAVKK